MIEPRVFDSAEAVGAEAARIAVEALSLGRQSRGQMTLGCPSGRTGRPLYAALGKIAGELSLDLSRLHLLMMDEFVERHGTGFVACPSGAHYSCAGFGEREIRAVLNAGLPESRRIQPGNVHIPQAEKPHAYETLIDDLGGIDCFILASGASDGHVAFNPPGTPADACTRVVELALETRQDNLSSFPQFGGISDVPRWGVTVGPRTIARASRSAIMILTGASKAQALARILSAPKYTPDWPSSIVHACANARIMVDSAAANGTIRAGQ
jgi:glucosamine-6-phosphate deaminase